MSKLKLITASVTLLLLFAMPRKLLSKRSVLPGLGESGRNSAGNSNAGSNNSDVGSSKTVAGDTTPNSRGGAARFSLAGGPTSIVHSPEGYLLRLSRQSKK